MNKTRVRFAPSPTGSLHIGSARTAYFNWLFAKKEKGRFILRIEDTDETRHQEDTVGVILDCLKWLSVDWDEGPDIGGDFGPYRQSERNAIYHRYLQLLLESKKAYRCFCSPEELSRRRLEAESRGSYFSYDQKCLKLSEHQIKENLKNNITFSIRILSPENKIISFRDKVYGKIEVNSSAIDDFIIIRSNGLPTYNFSAVIDDHLMKITHVIRGEDHLSNTPKQLLIYDLLRLTPPSFTHLPMILAKSGEKLSKRHGSVSIESYKKEGFLPEAIKNYLALLGWALDEKTTIFSQEKIINEFSLEKINKKPAKFDYDKLLFINASYIKTYDSSSLAKIVLKRFKKSLLSLKDFNFKQNNLKKTDISDPEVIKEIFNVADKKMTAIIPLVNKRAKTLNEINEMIYPFFFEITYSDEIKNFFKNKDINACALLEQAKNYLGKISEEKFCREAVEKNLRSLAAKEKVSFAAMAEVLRLALWGRTIGLPVFETIEILGKKKALSRLENYQKTADFGRKCGI